MTACAFRLREAVRHVRRGGLVAYPTESVYGLGCDPLDREAFEQLLELKGRALGKGVILIADAVARFEAWVAPIPETAWERMRATWPGAVTWVVPAADRAPEWIGGGRGTIAIRVPGHALARRLCSACQSPLVSTSANPAGLPPARTTLGVRRYFGSEALLVLAGEVGASRRPSTVCDALTGEVLRA